MASGSAAMTLAGTSHGALHDGGGSERDQGRETQLHHTFMVIQRGLATAERIVDERAVRGVHTRQRGSTALAVAFAT
jgi:hypothetical protein